MQNVTRSYGVEMVPVCKSIKGVERVGHLDILVGLSCSNPSSAHRLL